MIQINMTDKRLNLNRFEKTYITNHIRFNSEKVAEKLKEIESIIGGDDE